MAILEKYIWECLKDEERLNSPLKLSPDDFLYDGSIIISDKYILVGSDKLGRARKKLYSPKPDLAFAPFNLQEKTSGKMFNLCECVEKRCPLVRSFIGGLERCYLDNVRKYEEEIKEYISSTDMKNPARAIGEVYRVNKNPRSFIAVEVCFSGSMKHTFGSLVNASILGYYGVLVTNAEMLLKALRLKYYLLSITRQKRMDSVIGMNLFIITDEQLEKLLEGLNRAR